MAATKEEILKDLEAKKVKAKDNKTKEAIDKKIAAIKNESITK